MEITSIDRYTVNDIKSNIMQAFEFIKRVYNGGIETPEHFNTFTKLCQAHVDNCNYYCGKIMPVMMFIRPNRKKLYKDLLNTCEYTVSELKGFICEYTVKSEKQKEQEEIIQQIELRARVEHEIMREYRNTDHENNLSIVKQRPIGYCININEKQYNGTGNTGE